MPRLRKKTIIGIFVVLAIAFLFLVLARTVVDANHWLGNALLILSLLVVAVGSFILARDYYKS